MAKIVTNKQLIAAVAKSSKYHLYEVEDVLQHLIKVLQNELVQGNSIRLVGIGKLKMQKLKNKERIDAQGQKVLYNAFRLSVVSDAKMKDHLKENYVEPSTSEMAVSNVQ